jgi:hypothetical protein
MVARIRTYRGELVVVFSRDGEPDDARLVPNGERAAVTAVMMIAQRAILHPGDRLLVRQDKGDGNADD